MDRITLSLPTGTFVEATLPAHGGMVSIYGQSNSGKTTLARYLVAELVGRGNAEAKVIALTATDFDEYSGISTESHSVGQPTDELELALSGDYLNAGDLLLIDPLSSVLKHHPNLPGAIAILRGHGVTVIAIGARPEPRLSALTSDAVFFTGRVTRKDLISAAPWLRLDEGIESPLGYAYLAAAPWQHPALLAHEARFAVGLFDDSAPSGRGGYAAAQERMGTLIHGFYNQAARDVNNRYHAANLQRFSVPQPAS